MNRENNLKIAKEFQSLARVILSREDISVDGDETIVEILTRALSNVAKSDIDDLVEVISFAVKSELARAEYLRRREVNVQQDHMLIAIRKLGGLNVVQESDYAGRFAHLQSQGFNWSAIEQTDGVNGLTMDVLLEVMAHYGYVTDVSCRAELEDKLDQISRGIQIYSLQMDDSSRDNILGNEIGSGTDLSTSDELGSYMQYPESNSNNILTYVY